MIVHLNGDYETVDYVPNRSVLLYDNIEAEAPATEEAPKAE